jgi:hypothetical protein
MSGKMESGMSIPIEFSIMFKAGPIKVEYEAPEGFELFHTSVADFTSMIMELLDYVGDPENPPDDPHPPIAPTTQWGTITNEGWAAGTLANATEHGDDWESDLYESDGQNVEQLTLTSEEEDDDDYDDNETGRVPHGEVVGQVDSPRFRPKDDPLLERFMET